MHNIVCKVELGRRLIHLCIRLIQRRVPLKPSHIFRRNLPRLILKVQSDTERRCQCVWGSCDLCIDKVESNASLAYSSGLGAVLTFRQGFVAFQMALSAGKTSCSHSSRFGSLCGGCGFLYSWIHSLRCFARICPERWRSSWLLRWVPHSSNSSSTYIRGKRLL